MLGWTRFQSSRGPALAGPLNPSISLKKETPVKKNRNMAGRFVEPHPFCGERNTAHVPKKEKALGSGHEKVLQRHCMDRARCRRRLRLADSPSSLSACLPARQAEQAGGSDEGNRGGFFAPSGDVTGRLQAGHLWARTVSPVRLRPPSRRTAPPLVRAPSAWPFPACRAGSRACGGCASPAGGDWPGRSRAGSSRW